MIHYGYGDGDGIPEPVGDGDVIQFLIPLGMGRVTGKYVRIGYGDGEGKTRPHPAPLPCLARIHLIRWISRVSGVRTPTPAYNNLFTFDIFLLKRTKKLILLFLLKRTRGNTILDSLTSVSSVSGH